MDEVLGLDSMDEEDGEPISDGSGESLPDLIPVEGSEVHGRITAINFTSFPFPYTGRNLREGTGRVMLERFKPPRNTDTPQLFFPSGVSVNSSPRVN
ncbi:hypothetical protein AWENTII_000033 [Aspergillus wentii]